MFIDFCKQNLSNLTIKALNYIILNKALHNLVEIIRKEREEVLSSLSIVPNGHLLDVPNAFLGLLYYTTIFIIEQFLYHQITFLDMKVITVTLNSLAMSSSIYLAYKLIMIKELCLLCWTTHLLNLLLLFHYGKRLFVSSFGKEKEE